MALIVKIAGTSRNDRIEPGTLKVDKTLGEPWTCDFETKSVGTGGWQYPSVGEPVSIEIDSGVYFGGVVRRVERFKAFALSSDLTTRISCTDWNQVLERRLAGEYEWVGASAGTIIASIVTRSLADEGFDVSLVETGPTLNNFRIAYPTVAEAFAEIVKLCEGYRLYVDQDKKVRFFNALASPTTTPASFDVPVAARNIDALTVVETDEDYCNHVIGRVGQSLRDSQAESFEGDGIETSFQLAFPCALAPTITLNGVTNTVGVASVDTGRDWYWAEGSTEIRQDADGVPINGTLEVNYVGIESIYVEAKDLAEISARAIIEGGSGVYQKLLEIDQQLSRADAQAIVNGYLADHVTIPLVATYGTNDHIEPEARNLLPGTTQSMLLDGWGAQQTSYLVRSIKATAEGLPASCDFQFRYEIEAIYGSLTKTVFQWFKDLAGNGSANGSRTDGDTEYFYWFLGGCEAVSTGTDIAAHWPHVHQYGRLRLCSIHCKGAPTTPLVLDIQVTEDGSTWSSIFADGSATYDADRTTPLFFSNFSAAATIKRGQWFRVNVTNAGGATGLVIKMGARPNTNAPGALLGDNSGGTGVIGFQSQTETQAVL